MVIHKLPLSALVPGSCVDGAMPADAEIVHADYQHGVPTVWYRVLEASVTTMLKVVRFYLVGTGIKFDSGLRHLATFQRGEFVWHLLWEPRP